MREREREREVPGVVVPSPGKGIELMIVFTFAPPAFVTEAARSPRTVTA